MKNYRHGDIRFKKVSSLPKTAKRTYKGDKYIVAEGEVTGHAHRLASDGLEVFTEKDRTFLKMIQQGVLTHEEHNRISMEPGIYEVISEREHDVFQEVSRRVLD